MPSEEYLTESIVPLPIGITGTPVDEISRHLVAFVFDFVATT